MRHFLAAAIVLSFLSAPARAQVERWDARLASVSDGVTVIPADGSPEVSGEEGMPLEQGDRVVVDAGGYAEVVLDGDNLITVRENSDFKIEETSKGSSSFFLKIGSLLAKIHKLGELRLSVRTPTAVAAVRGTEFGVEVEGENSHFGVFDEGKVEVTGQQGAPPELLISNQELSVKKGVALGHAVQINRFRARRALMRSHGRRLAAIKAKWKALPPEQRLEMRKKAMERMRAHRVKMQEKRAALKNKIEEKRKQNAERGQQRRQENLKKMNERRQRIRRNR